MINTKKTERETNKEERRKTKEEDAQKPPKPQKPLVLLRGGGSWLDGFWGLGAFGFLVVFLCYSASGVLGFFFLYFFFILLAVLFSSCSCFLALGCLLLLSLWSFFLFVFLVCFVLILLVYGFLSCLCWGRGVEWFLGIQGGFLGLMSVRRPLGFFSLCVFFFFCLYSLSLFLLAFLYPPKTNKKTRNTD